MTTTVALVVVSVIALVLTCVCVALFAERVKRAREAGVLEREARRAETLEASVRHERARADEAELDRTRLEERARSQAESHERELAGLRERERSHREEIEKRLAQANEQMRDVFKASAQDAVDVSAKRMLDLANKRFGEQHDRNTRALSDLVRPISETLEKTDKKINELEKARVDSSASLKQQLEDLGVRSEALTDETRRLTQALRKPQVRGRYGEVQLERVAELAGMTSYCDFDTQATSEAGDGSRTRPDMVVKLPNGREIAVDAKTNIEPYLDALEAEDADEQSRHMERFAEGVLAQAKELSGKRYWANYDGSPEFCVMFIPGDQFIDAALERKPKLLELAASENILLASPSTLIGMLQAVAVGWREHSLSEAAGELFDLGKQLHERAAVVMEHTAEVGRHLDRTTRSYNKLVGSIETRLTPTLRRFEESGAKGAKEVAEIKQIETRARSTDALPFGAGEDERDG